MKLKDYSLYNAYDLLQDDDFLEYVLHPDNEQIGKWNRLQVEYPHLEKEIREAQKFIREMSVETQKMKPWEKLQTWERIQQRCKSRHHVFYWVKLAACVVLILTAVTWCVRKYTGVSPSAIELVSKPTEPLTDVRLILADRQERTFTGEETTLNYEATGRIRVNKDSATIEQKIHKETTQLTYNQLLVPCAKRSAITFHDGTKIWVNARSRVVYPVKFAPDRREIFVEGEVYLEVAKNENQPFYVKTKQFEVKVLGTSFDVRAYEDEAEQGVVLVTGKVNVVTKNKQKAVLTPNDRFVYQDGKGIVKLVDVTEYISWKEGVFCFERSCVGDILDRLAKYYGVEIDYEPAVKEISCSGKLELKSDLNEVLESLSKTAPIVFESVNSSVKIRIKEQIEME